MTDYEINKRLAEIAGHARWIAEQQHFERQGIVSFKRENPAAYSRDEYPPAWQPLTDWSQLGPLMEQHVWDIERHLEPTWSVWAQGFERHSVLPGATDPDLKRAICLAIIAAHEEGTT